jgi:hypothetical protein
MNTHLVVYQVVEAASCTAEYAKDHPQDLLNLYVFKGLNSHPNACEVRTVSW